MRALKIALAVAFASASMLTVSAVGSMGTAEAAAKTAKAAKPQPGKCGVGKFYDKKKKDCVSK